MCISYQEGHWALVRNSTEACHSIATDTCVCVLPARGWWHDFTMRAHLLSRVVHGAIIQSIEVCRGIASHTCVYLASMWLEARHIMPEQLLSRVACFLVKKNNTGACHCIATDTCVCPASPVAGGL